MALDIEQLKKHFMAASPAEIKKVDTAEAKSGGVPPHFDTGDVTCEMFKPGKDNLIRIVPAMANDPSTINRGWAFEINKFWLSGRSVLASNTRNKAGAKCPLMEKWWQVWAGRDEEAKVTWRPQHRFVCWLEDYTDIKDGAQPKLCLWEMPKTLYEEILNRSVNKRSRKVIDIANALSGRQIFFNRGGEGLGTKYSGIEIFDDETPVCDMYSLPHFNDLVKVPTIEEARSIVVSHASQPTATDDEDDSSMVG